MSLTTTLLASGKFIYSFFYLLLCLEDSQHHDMFFELARFLFACSYSIRHNYRSFETINDA